MIPSESILGHFSNVNLSSSSLYIEILKKSAPLIFILLLCRLHSYVNRMVIYLAVKVGLLYTNNISFGYLCTINITFRQFFFIFSSHLQISLPQQIAILQSQPYKTSITASCTQCKRSYKSTLLKKLLWKGINTKNQHKKEKV